MADVKLGPADLLEGELRNYRVEKNEVLISRVGGTLRAMDDSCNHAGCLLSGGRVEGKTIICPCHEVGFDLDDGKNLTSPGVCDDQPIFPVKVVGGEIVVTLPDKP